MERAEEATVIGPALAFIDQEEASDHPLGPTFAEQAWHRIRTTGAFSDIFFVLAPTLGRCITCGGDLPRFIRPGVDGETITLRWRETAGEERVWKVPSEVASLVRLLGLTDACDLLREWGGSQIELPTKTDFVREYASRDTEEPIYIGVEYGLRIGSIESLVRRFGFGASVSIPQCLKFVVIVLWIAGRTLRTIANCLKIDHVECCELIEVSPRGLDYERG